MQDVLSFCFGVTVLDRVAGYLAIEVTYSLLDFR